MILIQSSQQSQGLLIEFKWNRACKHSTKNVSYRSFISKPNVIFKWSITRQKHCVIQSVKWSYCIFIDQLTFVHDLRWLKSAVKDKTLRQNFFFSLNFIRFIYKARHYSTKGCKGFQPSLFSAAVSLQQLPLTCVVPDIACDLHKGAIALILPACCSQHSPCTILFPFWMRKSGEWYREAAFGLSWERLLGGYCQWCSTSSDFFFFFTWSSELEVVSTLAWGCHVSVPTLRFLFFFSEGCHFFFSRLNLIIIHSPSPWVWWGFRDNFTPNWYSSSHT